MLEDILYGDYFEDIVPREINTYIKDYRQLNSRRNKNKDFVFYYQDAPTETKVVRKNIGSELQIFSPGIRMPDDINNDQQRVCTPLESIKNGSDKIIMGRSLIKGDIIENINKVFESLKI